MSQIAGDTLANTLSGTSGNDTIWGDTNIGTPLSDTVTVGAGDSISADAGNDRVYGQGGDDVIDGGAGNDVLYGGTGNDSIIGGDGNDFIDGGAGNDTLYGGMGNDSIVGVEGNDFIDGGDGNDFFTILSGANYIDGGAGNDAVRFSSVPGIGVSVNLATPAAGADTLIGIEVIYGTDYNDTLIGDSNANTLRAGTGAVSAIDDNLVDGGAGNDYLVGSQGNDTIIGGTGDDILFPSLGDDTVSGGSGFDTLGLAGTQGTFVDLATGRTSGGIGNDSIDISPGNWIEVVRMSANWDDTVLGSDRAEGIYALGGNDSIDGGAGDDTLSGGAGTDTLSYLSASAGVTVNLATGAATGGAGNDSIDTSSGNQFEVLAGSTHADALTGSAGNDAIQADAGDDWIDGGAGNDTLSGGAGADTLSYLSATAAVTVSLASGTATGGAGTDSIDTSAGNQFEVLVGSTYADNLTGSSGDDTIFAGIGDDSVLSGTGQNIVDLGDGNDTLIGAVGGADTVSGGAGDDYILTDAADSVLGGTGNDTINTDIDNDTIVGGAGNDSLIAGTGDDIVWGDDTVLGAGAGIDTIYMDSNVGAPYDDTLPGGAPDTAGGNDTLFWQDGMGSDTAFGGGGADVLSLLGDTAGYNFVQNTTRDSINDWYVTKSGGTDTLTLFDFETVCFASGTMIATARGEVAVEELRLGDLVVTVGRGAPLQPVQWIGRSTARVAWHPDRAKVAPVRITAGALGRGVPFRDLRVSPDHALFLDGHLVPAKYLVNGTTVVQELWCRDVTYWHVEMPAHTLLVSDGALTESYLDDGNRKHFDNGAIATLFPDFESGRANGVYDRDACRPVLRGGRALEAIRARIATAPAAARAPRRA